MFFFSIVDHDERDILQYSTKYFEISKSSPGCPDHLELNRKTKSHSRSNSALWLTCLHADSNKDLVSRYSLRPIQ